MSARYLTALLLVAGCSRAAASGRAADTKNTPPSSTEPGTIHVAPESRAYLDVKAAQGEKAGAAVRAPARVAFRDGAVAHVAAPIEGRVTEVHVKVGDRVKTGDPLVTMNSPAAAAARADLESALVSRKATRAVVERQTAMLAKGVGVESEKFQAEIEAAKNDAEVARAERAVVYLGREGGSTVVVRAPIGGTVLARKTTVGAAAEPTGEPLIELGDPSALCVVADVFERDLALIKTGAGASVELATLANPARGQVTSVGSVLTSGLRTAPVYIALEDQQLPLRAGMYARATIEGDALDGVVVPVTAVLIKDGRQSIVYVEKDDRTFVQREVVVGQPLEGRVQVLGGLQPGERIVQHGALLIDGAADQLL